MNKLFQIYNQINSKLVANKFGFIFINFLLSIFISFIFFKLIFSNFEITQFEYNLESFILLALLILCVFILIHKFSKFFFLIFLLFLSIVFTNTNFLLEHTNYTVDELIYNYNYLSYEEALNNNILVPFPKKNSVEEAVTYTNPRVRNFSLYCINKNFRNTKNYSKHRKIIQYFAVFKEINTKWNYVNDPLGEDYIAKAYESLTYFSGDCDDHAILMCATIKSIGGQVRLVHTGKHMYPELKLNSKKELDEVIYLIEEHLFNNEFRNKTIYYHKDTNKNIWINLDYTAKHPGGPFLGETILSILEL